MAENLTKTELVEKIVKLIPNLDRHYLQSQNSIEQLKVMLKAHEEKIEELKPENYLSSRELSDRRLNKQLTWLLNYLWNKLTGQPELPFSFIGFIFGTVVCGAMMPIKVELGIFLN